MPNSLAKLLRSQRRSSPSNFGSQKLLSHMCKAQSLFGFQKLKSEFSCVQENYKAGGKHWVLDSGCSQHMTGNDNMFTSLEDPGDHEHVTYVDNSRGKVLGLGRIATFKDL